MKNPICISTGFLYRITNDRNEMIGKIKEFSPAGIELSFAHPEYLLNFIISQENLKYLKSLKFNSIHAPWQEVVYGNNQKSKNILKAAEKLYKQIKAKNVVFHKKQIGSIKIIKNYDFVASIENDDWKEASGNRPKKIEKILKENKNFKFTFDFAHAFTVSLNDIPIYINKFKDKLISIHLSIINKKTGDHDFLHKRDNKKMKNLLGHFKSVKVPLVLECAAFNKDQIPLIKKEIKYIKTL